MNTRYLQSPTAKSFSIHLLLLLMVLFFVVLGPKIKNQSGAISVSLMDEGNTEKASFPSDKTRIVKREKSAKVIGSGEYRHQARPISVSDLGVKINTSENWTSHVLGDAAKGGDYDEHLSQDAVSVLNTQESVFFSYFGRIHGQLYVAWRSVLDQEAQRYSDSGKQLPVQNYFITRTMVTLNSKGEILKVQLLQESGAVDLDSAAVAALNKAGPYPNPPRALLNARGNAEFPLSFIIRN